MEQSPWWKTAVTCLEQEISCILWVCEVHYCVHKVSFLSLMNPFHTLIHLIWFTSTFIFSCLCLDLPDGPFPSDFSTKPLHALLSCTSHHWPSKGYLERSINHEAPHYGTFFQTSCYYLPLCTAQFLNALSPWSRERWKCVCACYKGLWREQKYSSTNPFSWH